ncbi:glycerol kinase [candidate division KSB3 bacterium]|uniref:Glycerol kinase n=1 Tax=candidate division KSB3 bacterium TaxID=2044937 RepID=A0A2G6KFP4_9BACT|nr:MAG: glycerol kinase [candidate division KSB3 bacterium]
MKKFINDPENLTSELLEGYCAAYSDKVVLDSDKLVVRATPKAEDKVAIVTIGGAGHEPALSGFVGEGMLDVSVVGDIFAAPGPPKVFEALKKMNRPAGTLFVVLNHAGDVMSANMALQMAEKEGLKVKMLLTHEDIASGIDAPDEDRRGLVGCVPLYKIAGAAAEAGKSLEEIYEIAERMNQNMATLSVALKTATHPVSGEYISTLADDEMEIGMGQHGEGGGGRTKVKTADETAEIMLEKLLNAIDAKSGDKLLVMLNGSGATTLMEMFIVYRKVKQILDEKGIEIVQGMADEYLTVQEMAGFQMFVAKLDDEQVELLKAPCDTPYWTVR